MRTRLLALLLSLLVLAAPARATWSIVVVNHRTDEVCVASATCLAGFDLKPALCVLRVGEGGAAAQSVVDTSGANRLAIWNELANGTAPADIVTLLGTQDSLHQRRQYGIVSLRAGPATFTGSQCGQARFGVSGTTGDLSYAIQGNLLTGAVVVTSAEAALLSSSGDLPTRVMAAMLAARDMGGDGRCSCSSLLPTSCGAPPPSFTHSAATAFLVSSRLGDTDGVCNAAQGCANGQYWCDLRVIEGPPGGLDPVVRLANDRLPFWRGSLQGRADHFLTRVTPSAERFPADGASSITVDVELRNLEDQGIDPFAPGLLVTSLEAVPVASPGAVTDLGRGRLRFALASTGAQGRGTFRVVVTQGDGARVRLWPDLVIEAVAPAPLVCGRTEAGAAAGADVPLFLDAGASRAGASYLVLGSTSGTSPGFVYQGVLWPLNRDRFLGASHRLAPGSPFVDTAGALDAQGRATARFAAPPGFLAPLVGRRIDWAARVGGKPPLVTNADGFVIVP